MFTCLAKIISLSRENILSEVLLCSYLLAMELW